MAMLLFTAVMRPETGLVGDQIAWQNLDSEIYRSSHDYSDLHRSSTMGTNWNRKVSWRMCN